MSSRIARMQRGDRGALRELLSTTGAGLEALVVTLQRADAPATLFDVALELWRATAVEPPATDERAFAFAVAASRLARGPEPQPSATNAPDVHAFVELAARVAAGLGDALDREMLTRTAERAPQLAARAAAIGEAIVAAGALPPGPPADLERLWRELEPRLT